MACNYTSELTRHTITGQVEIDFNRCIGNYFSQSAMSWIEGHTLFDKGVLPFPGSYMDQPHKSIEIMRIIGGHKHEQLERQYSKQKLKGQSRASNGRE